MDNIILIENKHYTKNQLLLKLHNNVESYERLVDSFSSKGILNYDEGDIIITYVGLYIVDNFVIFVMPKFLNEDLINRNSCIDLVNLLREYKDRESLKVEEMEYLGYTPHLSKNLLGIIEFILKDHAENGLYINSEIIQKINGPGRIDWTRTIERNSVVINNKNEPVYTELVTINNNLDDNLLITNIHKYVINQCFSILKELSLIDIFNFEENHYDIDDSIYSDKDFLICHLNKELSSQYVDRKINILNAMISFIQQNDSSSDDNFLFIYGTKYFNIIWEKTTSFVFNNQYEKYKDAIPKPNWKSCSSETNNYRDTLIPDILNLREDLKTFFILDAKYYTLHFNNEGIVKGTVPGISDIVKQLAYESVFKDKFNNRYNIYNAFLIPTMHETKVTGTVEFNLFNTYGKIFNIHLNYNEIFSMYRNYMRYGCSFWTSKAMLEQSTDIQLNAIREHIST